MKYLISWNVLSVGRQQAVVNTPEEVETVKAMLEKEECDYDVRRVYTLEDVAYHKVAEEIKEDDDRMKVYGRIINRMKETYDDFIFSFVVSGLEEEVEYKINKGMLKKALVEYKEKHPEEFEEGIE